MNSYSAAITYTPDVTLLESIADIDDQEWKALCHPTPYSDLRWLRAVEANSKEVRRQQVLVARCAGRITGAMLLEIVSTPLHPNGAVRFVLGGSRGRLQTLGRTLVPHIGIGACAGYGGHILFASSPAGASRSAIASCLISAAETTADRSGLGLWYTGVLATDSFFLQELMSRDYLRARFLPIAVMDVNWATYDEYLTWLNRQSRSAAKDARRERNRLSKSAVVLTEVSDIALLAERLAELSAKVAAKYGRTDFGFRADYFADLKLAFGQDYVVCTANRHGQTIGYVSLLCHDGIAWADSYGLDHLEPDTDFLYLNLAYHWAVEMAMRRNIRQIVFGRGHYSLKTRRGCRLVETYFLRKPSNPLVRHMCRWAFRCLDQYYDYELRSGSRPLRERRS